jgi:hypothetical protein
MVLGMHGGTDKLWEVFKSEQLSAHWNHTLPIMDHETFRAICVRVADEKDPKIIELFKQRLRLLLADETLEPSPDKNQARLF